MTEITAVSVCARCRRCCRSRKRSRGCSRAPGRSSPSRFRSPRPPAGCWRRTSRALIDLPPFRELGDGRLRDQGGGRPGRVADRLPDRGGACRPSGRWRPARRWRSLRAARCRPGPTQSCRSRTLSNRTTASSVRIRSRRERTSGRSGATCAPANRCSLPGRCSAPLRSARSPRPGSPRSRAAAGPGSSFSAPGRSCARRARRSVQARSTSRTAPMLAAAFEAAGAVVDRIGPVADDEEEHRRALEWGLEADVLVTSGGVSVGPHDLVRRMLGELGVEEDFWGVAVKPGKPLAFATRGATLVFGLPGNPVSALVGVELFVRPALRALQGDASPGPNYASARLRVRSTERRAGRARAGARRATTATRRRRAGERPGVAHDRPRRGGRTRWCSCRPARASSRPARSSATCGWASPAPSNASASSLPLALRREQSAERCARRRRRARVG